MADVPANEIIPGVWISGYREALDPMWLQRNGIVAVFNCTKDIQFHPSVPRPYRVPVNDYSQPEDLRAMEEWAPEIAYKILSEYRQGHPILIHCYAGKQRSTTSCAFFLMVLTGLPLIQVMQLIKQKRPVAFEPRPNFAIPLRRFEELVMTQLRAYHQQ